MVGSEISQIQERVCIYLRHGGYSIICVSVPRFLLQRYSDCAGIRYCRETKSVRMKC